SLPADGRAVLGRRPDPLVEAVVDDVHPSADAPAAPGDPVRGVEDLPVRFVELDIELVKHGGPEPLGLGDRPPQQVVVVAKVMAPDECRQAALLDVVACRPPGNVPPEFECVGHGAILAGGGWLVVDGWL